MNTKYLIVMIYGHAEIHELLFDDIYCFTFSGTEEECGDYLKRRGAKLEEVGIGTLVVKPLNKIN